MVAFISKALSLPSFIQLNQGKDKKMESKFHFSTKRKNLSNERFFYLFVLKYFLSRHLRRPTGRAEGAFSAEKDAGAERENISKQTKQ
jgi:hypothetical protein